MQRKINESINAPVLVLVGPTAIGKTDLSLHLASEYDCEIISMDSMQVYRYMDIGTAKVTVEERGDIPHHLIDILNPDEQYDAARFVHDALTAIKTIVAKGKTPLITGGTGLYLAALLRGLFDEPSIDDAIRITLRERLASEGREVLYQELRQVDPVSHARIHVNDTQRLLRGLEIYQSTGIPWSEHLARQRNSKHAPLLRRTMQIGLTCEKEMLHNRIKERSFKMMNDKFHQEVEFLLAKGYSPDLPSMQAIGYRHMYACISGQWEMEAATTMLIQDTQRYAKRQMTWFRRQQEIQWYDIREKNTIIYDVKQFFG